MAKNILLLPILALLPTTSSYPNMCLDCDIGNYKRKFILSIRANEKTDSNRPRPGLASIVKSDLLRTGLFNIHPFRSKKRPQGNVLTTNVSRLAGGRYQLKISLIREEAGGRKIQVEKRLTSNAIDFRKTAHRLSNLVYKSFTGKPGVFHTRIAFVGSTKNADAGKTWYLATADVDGNNVKKLFTTRYRLMSPAWSPKGNRLAYVALRRNRNSGKIIVEVKIYNFKTSRRMLVSSRKGINGAPSWSPDGSKLAMTLSIKGNPDVYIHDLKTGKLRQLTFSKAIDTEAAWAPDGKFIFFTSDRGGNPQIHRVSLQSGKVNRVTYQGRYNTRSMASPDGRWITMIHGVAGRYNVALLDLKSNELRVLTVARLDASPSFSPDGKMLVYVSEYNSKRRLYAISVDGDIVRHRLGSMADDIAEVAWGR